MNKTVFVGLSGGVDSSVTAALLKQQGYHVVGVYMKNWSQDLPGFVCPWKQDYNDAKRVAVQLDIPFKLYDFQDEYKKFVVDYMIDEYQSGRTPNPDIMCNQEVKFKLFWKSAVSDGADMIATGHYARTHGGQLLTAKNEAKDQTYFLYRVSKEALESTVFPLGNYVSKDEVRAEAKRLNLVTASKKDSQGICFVGKVGIREFLERYVDAQPGDIKDENGKVIGRHDGAIFYTIGQRRGLGVGGGLPYYVTGKDMEKNEVYVSQDLQSDELWTSTITCSDFHWINEQPEEGKSYQVRTRYRAPLVSAELKKLDNTWQVVLENPVRAVTPGQSVVIYDTELVLGGGIVV